MYWYLFCWRWERLIICNSKWKSQPMCLLLCVVRFSKRLRCLGIAESQGKWSLESLAVSRGVMQTLNLIGQEKFVGLCSDWKSVRAEKNAPQGGALSQWMYPPWVYVWPHNLPWIQSKELLVGLKLAIFFSFQWPSYVKKKKRKTNRWTWPFLCFKKWKLSCTHLVAGLLKKGAVFLVDAIFFLFFLSFLILSSSNCNAVHPLTSRWWCKCKRESFGGEVGK